MSDGLRPLFRVSGPTFDSARPLELAGFYERLMNQLDDEDDRRAVIHAAKRFYKLYGDVFRTLRDDRNLLAEAA